MTELLSLIVNALYFFKMQFLEALKDSKNGLSNSKYYLASNISGLYYIIKIFPNGHTEERSGETWIFLFILETNERKITANFTLSIESTNFVNNVTKLCVEPERYGFKCCTTAEFFDSKNNFFVEGEITIKLEGIFSTVRSIVAGIETPINIESRFKKADLIALKDFECINGKCFYAFNNPGLQYFIRISPNGDDEKRSGQTWIFLYANGSAERNITAEFTISVESADFKISFCHVFKRYTGWGIACSKSDDFFMPSKKFFVNGEITIKIQGILKAERSLKISCPISMIWKIKEHDLKAKKNENFGSLRSKRFNILAFSNVNYYISLNPNVINDGSPKHTGIYLNIELGGEKKVEAIYDFSFDSANINLPLQFIFNKSTGGGANLCSTDDLFNPFKKYIFDGFLIIKISGVLMVEKDQTAELICINGLELNALEHCQEKDFTIIVGKKEIQVHKKVLMDASSVFAGMLESGMKEAIENKMIIDEEEFSFEVVDTAVQLCYNAFFLLEFNLEDMLSLYKFADKYDIKGSVEDSLIKGISASNVVQLVHFSTTFNAEKLHQNCVEFVIKCLEGRTPVLGSDTLD
uniref:BTB domain-containing protein n=1 Tax=Panagrolaimus sp. ES5 TaxID=591445 RepID=A0AC34G0H1_9BILA